MRRVLLLLIIAASMAACSSDDEAATPTLGGSGAPLNDDAIGPSEAQSTMGE